MEVTPHEISVRKCRVQDAFQDPSEGKRGARSRPGCLHLRALLLSIPVWNAVHKNIRINSKD
jgi:hypothetical protein